MLMLTESIFKEYSFPSFAVLDVSLRSVWSAQSLKARLLLLVQLFACKELFYTTRSLAFLERTTYRNKFLQERHCFWLNASWVHHQVKVEYMLTDMILVQKSLSNLTHRRMLSAFWPENAGTFFNTELHSLQYSKNTPSRGTNAAAGMPPLPDGATKQTYKSASTVEKDSPRLNNSFAVCIGHLPGLAALPPITSLRNTAVSYPMLQKHFLDKKFSRRCFYPH